MYRISIAHQEAEHPNSATFAWGPTYDGVHEAYDVGVAAAAERFRPENGYTLTVQELVNEGDSASWVDVTKPEEATP